MVNTSRSANTDAGIVTEPDVCASNAPRSPVTAVPPVAAVAGEVKDRIRSTNAVVASCVVAVFSAAVGAAGVDVNVGLLDKTADPVPVTALKFVKPASQSSLFVDAMPIHTHIAVVPGKTVITKLPPEELTVRLPVLLLAM